MANQVEKVNAIAIADIEKINNLTDDNMEKISGLEFTGVTDAMTLIETRTESDVTSITFDSGISSTYDMFIFEVINAHSHGSEGTQQNLQFAVNATDTADYDDIYINAGLHYSYHDEDDATPSGYVDGSSLDGARNTSQHAGYVNLTSYEGNVASESSSGRLIIWGLGSGSYVKNFVSEFSTNARHDSAMFYEARGSIGNNDVTAIDDVNFKYKAGGNISATIHLWGMAKS